MSMRFKRLFHPGGPRPKPAASLSPTEPSKPDSRHILNRFSSLRVEPTTGSVHIAVYPRPSSGSKNATDRIPAAFSHAAASSSRAAEDTPNNTR
jgi:hypothetical protein